MGAGSEPGVIGIGAYPVKVDGPQNQEWAFFCGGRRKKMVTARKIFNVFRMSAAQNGAKSAFGRYSNPQPLKFLCATGGKTRRPPQNSRESRSGTTSGDVFCNGCHCAGGGSECARLPTMDFAAAVKSAQSPTRIDAADNTA
jgi:hypothetical protein